MPSRFTRVGKTLPNEFTHEGKILLSKFSHPFTPHREERYKKKNAKILLERVHISLLVSDTSGSRLLLPSD